MQAHSHPEFKTLDLRMQCVRACMQIPDESVPQRNALIQNLNRKAEEDH
jgi:hypothetical protein